MYKNYDKLILQLTLMFLPMWHMTSLRGSSYVHIGWLAIDDYIRLICQYVYQELNYQYLKFFFYNTLPLILKNVNKLVLNITIYCHFSPLRIKFIHEK